MPDLPELPRPRSFSGRIADRVRGRGDRDRHHREVEHLAEHPHIPEPLIVALQRGADDNDPLFGATVVVHGVVVHVAVSPAGTGIPEPRSQDVWDGLCAAVRDVLDQPFCADVVASLPRELAAVVWTTDGRTVTIAPCGRKPTRLRSWFGLALLPLTRAGELVTVSTAGVSASAMILGGTFTPVTAPAAVEPVPDLQPKTSITAPIRPDLPSRAPAEVRHDLRAHQSAEDPEREHTAARPRPTATTPPPRGLDAAVPSPRTVTRALEPHRTSPGPSLHTECPDPLPSTGHGRSGPPTDGSGRRVRPV